MGSALIIELPAPLKAGTTVKVTVYYKTTEGCTALQWLDKESACFASPYEPLSNSCSYRQTQGKKHPYLFSQCQPIYARSLAPVQDTPSIKTVSLGALITQGLVY